MGSHDPFGLVSRLAEGMSGLASGRRGTVVALVGPPGSGKSWAARTLLTRLPFRHCTVRAAAPPAVTVATLPTAQAPAWAARVLEGAARGEGLGTDRLAAALAAHLAALAPFALLVEDLHEAEAGGELWRQLAQAVARSHGVGLVITSRNEPVELAGAARIESLDPLGTEEIVALLRNETGADLPPPALAFIAERARGNPLFALENFRYLTRQGNLWSDGNQWRWRRPDAMRVPASLEALVSARLRSAGGGSAERLVLQARAILREPLQPWLWSHLVDLPPKVLLAAQVELARTGVLRDGEFTHPLYREMALRELPADRRRQLARRAIAALADEPVLAAEYLDLADLPETQARELWVTAARALEGRGDPEGAGRCLARASEWAEGEEAAALALEAAKRLRPYDLAAARRLAERAVRAGCVDADALFLLAETLVLLGEGEEADRWLAALPDTTATAGRRWRQEVVLLAERGEFGRAVAAWRGRPDFQPEADGLAARAAAFSLLNLGSFDEAEELVQRFLAMPDLPARDRANLLHVRAAVSFHRGAFIEAAEAWQGVAEALRGTDELHLLGRALGNRATALRAIYRLDEARAAFERSLAIFEQLGAGRDHARQQHGYASLLRMLGEYERAEEALLECRAVFERLADHSYLVACDIDLAVLYIDWSPAYAAELSLRYAGSALDSSRRLGSAPLLSQALRVAARAEARHGDASRALELVEEGIATARSIDQESSIANCVWTKGHVLESLGRVEDALAAFREAVALHEDAGRELQAQICALEIDRLTHDIAAVRRREDYFRAEGSVEGLRQIARYFPTDDSRPAPARLAIRALGPFVVELDGEPTGYRAPKGIELLARLLEARMAGRVEVGQLELQDALYPQRSGSAAAAALQQLIYRVRNALGPAAVVTTGSGYALGGVDSDAESFLAGGRSGLWRGPFLADVGGVPDESLRRRLNEELRARVRLLMDRDRAESFRLAAILLDAEPFDLDALRLALEAAASPTAAAVTYLAARRRFEEVGETLPGDWREFLARGLRGARAGG